MKLQDAYASETAALGTWTLIGYVAPGAKASDGTSSTTNFTYSGGTTVPATTCATGTLNSASKCEVTAEDGTKSDGTANGSSLTKGWIATNVAQRNDCSPAANWDVSASIGLSTSNKDS